MERDAEQIAERDLKRGVVDAGGFIGSQLNCPFILSGGGIALLRAMKALDGLKAANDDQQSRIDIARQALRAPARQIAENAGKDGAWIVGKLLESGEYNGASTRQPASMRT